MPRNDDNTTDPFTTNYMSSVFADWIKGVKEFLHWYTLLQDAIEDHDDVDWQLSLAGNPKQQSIAELSSLQLRIEMGIIQLQKNMDSISEKASAPHEVLQLIEHTKIMLEWCVEIKEALGENLPNNR